MGLMIVSLLLAFGSGFCVGIVLADKISKKADELDLNKDGKIDEKDLEVAKKELKKVAAKTTTLAKKVK